MATKIKFNKALTLIEVMIVLVVLGLLIISALWAWQKSVGRGDDARRKSDIHRIKVAIEEYEKDHDCYPTPDIVSCLLPPSNPGTGLRPYMDKIPCDPKTGQSYYYDYDTLNPSCPKWYRLFADLEDTDDSVIRQSIGLGGNYNYYDGSPNAPTPTTFNGSSPLVGTYYGCFSGVCQKIDNNNPCDTNFTESDCLNKCMMNGEPATECHLR